MTAPAILPDATAVAPPRTDNPVQSLLKDLAWYRQQGASPSELDEYVRYQTTNDPALRAITNRTLPNVKELKAWTGLRGALFNYAEGVLMNNADELEGVIEAASANPRARRLVLGSALSLLGGVNPLLANQRQAAMTEVAATPEYGRMQQSTEGLAKTFAAAHPGLAFGARTVGALLPFLAAPGAEAATPLTPLKAAGASAGVGGATAAVSAAGQGASPANALKAGLAGGALSAALPFLYEGVRGMMPGAAAARRAGAAVNLSEYFSPAQLRRAANGVAPLGVPLKGEAAVRAAAANAGPGSVPADWTEPIQGLGDFAATNNEAVRQHFGPMMKWRGPNAATTSRQVAGGMFDALDQPLTGAAADDFRAVAKGISANSRLPAVVRNVAKDALNHNTWGRYHDLITSLRQNADMIARNAAGPSPTHVMAEAEPLTAWKDRLEELSSQYIPGFDAAMERYSRAASREDVVLDRQKRTLAAFGGSATARRLGAAGELNPDAMMRSAEWSPSRFVKHVLLSPFYGVSNRATAGKLGPMVFQPQSAEDFLRALLTMRRAGTFPSVPFGAGVGYNAGTLPPWGQQ